MTECVTIGNATLYLGDCLEVLRGLPDASVEAVVTDPPAGIAFMGKAWDHHKGGRKQWVAWMTEVAAECLRVMKPGGHALVWAIPRTSHWTATAWEDAGFEIRDRIAHVFGSGFPKSADVGKALDKAAGKARPVIGDGPFASRRPETKNYRDTGCPNVFGDDAYERPAGHVLTAPATEVAKQWSGYGTALKPAVEDWWLARKPLDGTVAQNVLKHGCGGLNIDGCRVPAGTEHMRGEVKSRNDGAWRQNGATGMHTPGRGFTPTDSPLGRFPPNLLHDGSAEVVAMFPDSSVTGRRTTASKAAVVKGTAWGVDNHESTEYTDSGTAARFYPSLGYGPDDYDVLKYCPKASKADRDAGLDGHEERACGLMQDDAYEWPDGSHHTKRRNHHPTVKPQNLMRWLVRLVTPAGGTVLDPFTGSGSTGKAAMLEGFKFIGIEREPEYLDIARARIAYAQQQAVLPLESAA